MTCGAEPAKSDRHLAAGRERGIATLVQSWHGPRYVHAAAPDRINRRTPDGGIVTI